MNGLKACWFFSFSLSVIDKLASGGMKEEDVQ
jgi:hypothetical protein